jgi:WD40 repeat protein
MNPTRPADALASQTPAPRGLAAGAPPATGPAKLVATLRGHVGPITALAFTSDRSLLASGSRDGTGRVWDVAARKPGERSVLPQHGEPFHSLAFAPNGRLLAAGSGAADGLVRMFDVSDGEPREVGVLRGARGPVDALAFSPDGRLVAAAGEDRTLRIWEHGPGSRGEARTILAGHTGPVRALAFAPDGQGVATASRDGTVRVWALSRIRSWERAALPHGVEVAAVAFGPNGKTLATACRGGAVRLWDLAAVKPSVRAEFDAPPGGVRVLLVAPDSGALVGVGEGPRVVNWDLTTGRPVREWELPGGTTSSAALTPDGRYLGRGTADGAVEVYRVAEKRP